MITVSADMRPHLEAIADSMRQGFRFLHLTEPGNEDVTAIHAFREHNGAVDAYTVCDTDDAVAERFLPHQGADSHPLWQATGPVAQVVRELLALPPHGTPGAPTRPVIRHSRLWTPGQL